jgi:predicted AAA+ superfamily ATPase
MSSRLFLKRTLTIDFRDSNGAILFGPRKTGKTTLVNQKFPGALKFDLLKTDVKSELQLRPQLLREIVLAEKPKIIVIDEIQKVPQLLDEVHWLLENTNFKILLCGSSARKLKKEAANLLGGRAVRFDLFPLTFCEIKNFSIEKSINHGLLPQHYLHASPERLIKAYISEYINEEIAGESQVRNLPVFHRFLELAALMNGELLNYANLSRECGVAAKTIREYYQILADTLIGFRLIPWTKVKTRKLIETEKFYLFDTAVIRVLKGFDYVEPNTVEFGNLFETLIINEIRAYLSYRSSSLKLSYWRTTSGFEVDVIIGNMEVVIELKSNKNLRDSDLKGIRALAEEHSPKHKVVVCFEEKNRQLMDGILICNYKYFLTQLWDDYWLTSR